MTDLYENMRVILERIRAEGGRAEIHAKDFGLGMADYTQALQRLKANKRIRNVANSIWEVLP